MRLVHSSYNIMNKVLCVTFLICMTVTQATEYCPGLHLNSISLSINCLLNGGDDFSGCEHGMKEGIFIRASCSYGYHRQEGNTKDTIFCNAGRWTDDLIKCEQVCGINDVNTVANPWIAYIVVKDRLCGGMIISAKIVISAADCFWDEAHRKEVDISDVFLSVNWDFLDVPEIVGVAEIHLIERSKDKTNYRNEIAILVLEGYIKFSAYSRPICLDLSSGIEESMNIGLPSITSVCESVNTSLDSTAFQSFCEGRNNTNDICLPGSGFINKTIVNGVETYFLAGIVTSVPIGNFSCSASDSISITNIQRHSAVIFEYVKKYQDYNYFDGQKCQVPFIPNLKVYLAENNNNETINAPPGTYLDNYNKITYSCVGNNRLFGTRTNFCYTSYWSENHPACIEVSPENATEPIVTDILGTCKLPSDSNLLIFDYYDQHQISEDLVESVAKIRYKCKKNYLLVGPVENQCFVLDWYKKHPTCIEIPSEPLSEESCEVPFLPNTNIILESAIRKNLSFGNSVESSKTVLYRCPEYFTLHGETSNHCHEGKWLVEHPICISIIIGNPNENDCIVPEIRNGFTDLEFVIRESASSDISYAKQTQEIYYRCRKNYDLKGVSYNECRGGSWINGDHPECNKINKDSCQIPAVPNLIVILTGQVKKTVSAGNYVENYSLVTYKCKENHILLGRTTNNCIDGKWSDDHPTCTKYCKSEILKGVTFSAICEIDNERISCNQPYLLPKTIAKIVCQYGYRKPDPFVQDALFCDDMGHWDYEPFRCEAICGRELIETVPYIRGGDKANITSVPWHAAIYSSLKDKYLQFCGGTIISANLVLSAAHCFWQGQDLILDKSYVSVAVGKYYRDYYAEEPLTVQYFNVTEIYIPEGFKGPLQAYRDDIAILALIGFIEYKPYIKPICIERLENEARTVSSGLKGRVAGWGRTNTNLPSEELKMLEISTLSFSDCLNSADAGYRNEIASDKFCISSAEEESVCPGDSGGGFVIPQVVNGVKTYFLQGIVSNALTNRTDCKDVNLTALTNIQHYQHLILRYEKKYGTK